MERINKFNKFNKINEGRLSKEYIEDYLENNLQSDEDNILDHNDRYVLISDVIKVVNNLFEKNKKNRFFNRRNKETPKRSRLTEGPEITNTKNVTSEKPNIKPAPQGRRNKNY